MALLFMHVRQSCRSCSAIGELIHYVSLSGAAPWNYALLLQETTRAQALAAMEAVWHTVNALETSDEVIDVEFWQTLAMTRWPIFREPLLIGKRNNFRRASTELRSVAEPANATSNWESLRRCVGHRTWFEPHVYEGGPHWL